MMAASEVLYTADRHTDAFDQRRLVVDVVCAGDSITGWNNFGPVAYWPYPAYPQFLQEMCQPFGLRLANGGIAGEVSPNGIGQVQDYLELFPAARYFIIGYGTNDLGTWPDTERTSKRLIENLGQMVQAVTDRGERPVLFNVPHANESMFPPRIVEELHAKRDYHNARLKEYCDRSGVPLADICSRLRGEHFADELHPNGAGATIIAEEVFAVLQAVLPREEE